jgi:SnoaL-like domain
MTTLTIDEPTIRYLLDRLEIQDLIARYALGQDLHIDGDNDVLDEWKHIFATDAKLDYSVAGAPSPISPEQIVEIMRGPNGSMGALKRWQHFQGVAIVEIDDDVAAARTPHIHTHQGETNGNGWNLIQTGFFVDRLERGPEGWRIVDRKLEILWMDTFATIPNPLAG